jgi:CubicO group peptidase (beta-lactamase class C family)
MKTFKRCVAILLVQCVVICMAIAQVSMQAKAELSVYMERTRDSWNEGFSRIIDGTVADYESHRSNGSRDRAFVARSGNKESKLTWKTGPIHTSSSNDSLRIVWVCGFGNNVAQEDFRLVCNEQYQFRFTTTSEPSWSVSGTNGGRLGFSVVYQNHNKANFGYMYLVLPRQGIKNGNSATIRIESLPSKRETWYRTYAYPDAFLHFLRTEVKPVLSEISFMNLGDAVITAYASTERSGKSVVLQSKNKELARGVFRAEQNLAIGRFDIPRKYQNEWGHYVLLSTGDILDTLWLDAIEEQRTKAFLDEELEFDKYVFTKGHLPLPRWKRPEMVVKEIGNAQLNVSYFSGAMQSVEEAHEAGRYAAVVRITLPSGFIAERFVTLYCSSVAMDDYSSYVPIVMLPDPGLNISARAWERYASNRERYSFGSFKTFPAHEGDAAIFLSGLSELDSVNGSYDTPRLRDRQWWINLKTRTPDGLQKINPLKRPKYVVGSTIPSLVQSAQPAGYYAASDLEALRALCRSASDKMHQPMVTLIAHQGRIVFHEAYGNKPDGTPVGRDTPMWMASITKLLTGVLLMQFVDQGIVDLDAPVSHYLPELVGGGTQKLTVRHLMTHTSGLAWVGEWGSDWEPSLENRIAYALPYAHVGERFEYHRIGYALAGRIMERISGIAVPYLFREYIFDPLKMKSAYADNTYGGLYCTAEDLAILGQALLQNGRYGSTELFSKETFNKMLPVDLSVVNPKLDRKWGIGTASLGGNGLSELAYGHEAASGAILRIDPKNELIVISARNHIGENYGEYEQFVRALIESATKPFRTTK